jgi:DNA-binding CsgD family transcriptional regulator
LAALHLGRAQLHRSTGDPQAALDGAARAVALASEPRQPPLLLAAHRLAGELALDLERLADAERHLAEALAIAETIGARFDRALTLLALARLRAEGGRVDEAARWLAEAAAVFGALAAGPALSRAEALREALSTPAPATGRAALTAREREVLRLVARGMTDAEIGAVLSISYRTVGQHLRSVYAKLGVSSRAGATRIAVEHHLG